MTTQQKPDSITAEIVIQAPAARVFDALADPAQRVQWWGREGMFQATDMESDLRVGGAWLMRGTRGDGQPFTVQGVYRTVEPPHRLEFTWNPDWEAEPETVVSFELIEQDGSTTVRLTHGGFAGHAVRDRYQGWPWLLGRLRGHVQQDGDGEA